MESSFFNINRDLESRLEQSEQEKRLVKATLDLLLLLFRKGK